MSPRLVPDSATRTPAGDAFRVLAAALACVVVVLLLAAGGVAASDDAPLLDEADRQLSSGATVDSGQTVGIHAPGDANAVYALYTVDQTDGGYDTDRFITEIPLNANGSALVETGVPRISGGEYVVLDGDGDPVVFEDGVAERSNAPIGDATFTVEGDGENDEGDDDGENDEGSEDGDAPPLALASGESFDVGRTVSFAVPDDAGETYDLMEARTTANGYEPGSFLSELHLDGNGSVELSLEGIVSNGSYVVLDDDGDPVVFEDGVAVGGAGSVAEAVFFVETDGGSGDGDPGDGDPGDGDPGDGDPGDGYPVPLRTGADYWSGQTPTFEVPRSDETGAYSLYELDSGEDGTYFLDRFVTEVPAGDRARITTAGLVDTTGTFVLFDTGSVVVVRNGTVVGTEPWTGSADQVFSVRVQTLRASVPDPHVGPGENLTVEIGSNRERYDLALSSPDVSEETLESAFGATTVTAGTESVLATTVPQLPDGVYELRLSVTDAAASTTVRFAVGNATVAPDPVIPGVDAFDFDGDGDVDVDDALLLAARR